VFYKINEEVKTQVSHPKIKTTTDAAIALNFAVRGEYDTAADVSGDGRVTSLDALIILQMAAAVDF